MQTPAIVPSAPTSSKVVPATPVPAAASAKQQAALASQVEQAKRAAMAKHTDLAMAGSEINSRFVFRYKELLAQQSPRLQDPTWPLQLADECAAASVTKIKQTSHQ